LDAAAAISYGLCNTAIVFGGQAGVLNNSSLADYTQPNNEFVQPWGFFTAAHFAMVAQVYFDRFKPSRSKLSQIAVDIRNAGSRNPEAVMFGRGPYEVSDVVESPLVCDPFHLLDLCLATEGASAILITSLERALDCPNAPIRILGGASEWHRQQYVDPARYDEVGSIGEDAFSRTFATAGLTAEEIDVYELYDINTWEVVRQFETLGMCPEGEGVDFLFENGITVDGKYPTNTDGGLLSFSHTGWGGPNLKVIEAVRQLRGTSTGDQIANAETALVTGAGSGAQYFNAAILAKNY
jgi:acetyl-CoA acetyltransferase